MTVCRCPGILYFVSCKNFSMSSVTSDDGAGGFRTVSFTFLLLALACFTIGLPPNIITLFTGTPEMVHLNLGNPHFCVVACLGISSDAGVK